MAMRDRYLTFDGTDLKTAYGLVYSKFEEELPQPKVITVDIPAGSEIDITAALGDVAYHNGKHTLTFLVYGETQAERLAKTRGVVAKVHGVLANYKLSWKPYTYKGRGTVSVRHLTEKADLVTISIDRSPWATASQESVVLDCHPTANYTIDDSKKLSNIKLEVNAVPYTVTVTGEDTTTISTAGKVTLVAAKVGDVTVGATYSEWLLYFDSPDMVVNPNKISISNGNATINGSYTISGTNVVFDLSGQKAKLYFNRTDVA